MKNSALIKSFMILYTVTSMCSCLGQDDFMQNEEDVDFGKVELSFTGKTETRSSTTTISPEEAKNFLITVSQGGQVVRGPQTLGTMNMRFPVLNGIVIWVQNVLHLLLSECQIVNLHLHLKLHTMVQRATKPHRNLFLF